ncbi:MAG TPA: acetyltransferase [Bacteroidia bacterium]|nr:acetyltransferase [Bacteroidia bacterium]
MKVVIVGARADGHAKVVLEILLAMKKFTVAGFIDDDPAKKGLLIRGIPVIGGMSDLPDLIAKNQIAGAMAAIGHNEMRRNLSEQIEKFGLELINAIHPTVHFDSDVVIGKGCYIGQGVIVVTGSKIGNSVNIHTGTTIDHDNVIEDGANIGPGTHTAGRVHIGKDAFLGTGTNVIPDCRIGEGAITGAGTVVIRDLEPFTKSVGVPARTIGKEAK